jgi:multidrug resistance efflux pump
MPGEALIAGEPLVVISHGASAEEAVTPPDAAGEDETVTAQAADDANAAATDGGQTVRTVLTSPCDCTLISRSLETGASVAAGETVALLAPGGSGGHIEALFSPARAPRPGDVVAVDLPASGERYEGVVEAIGPAEDPESILDPPAAARDGDGALLARIRTRPALPVTRAGDLAIVTVTPGA